MLAFTRYAAPVEPSVNDFSFFDFFNSQPSSPRTTNKVALRTVYAAPPSPKSKVNRSTKSVRFHEDVRVRIIHRDPEEDVPLSVWLASLPEVAASAESSESDSDASLSSSPPRKVHRMSSSPEKKQSPSFFATTIFKAFETHNLGAVRCR